MAARFADNFEEEKKEESLGTIRTSHTTSKPALILPEA
jgi:hypothetical protein